MCIDDKVLFSFTVTDLITHSGASCDMIPFKASRVKLFHSYFRISI